MTDAQAGTPTPLTHAAYDPLHPEKSESALYELARSLELTVAALRKEVAELKEILAISEAQRIGKLEESLRLLAQLRDEQAIVAALRGQLAAAQHEQSEDAGHRLIKDAFKGYAP